MNNIIAQIGNGFVGGALHKSFEERGVSVIIYDKFQRIGKLEDVLDSNIVFLCLPTPYVENYGFDLSCIYENFEKLSYYNYKGLCVIKSTVEPGVTKLLGDKYGLNVAHNPEFLTERTALQDFNSQKHIVLGKCGESKGLDDLILLYKSLYPDAMISVCSSDESEAMKLFANCFYAQKVMIFNEFYLLSKELGIDFERVKQLIVNNGWISPNHMQVPGPDGRLAYGGHCFPKDTNALNQLMSKLSTPNMVIDSVIKERNKIRGD